MDLSYTSEREHHIAVKSGEIGRYVILTGDPGRCAGIAGYFDSARKIAENREYVTYTGKLDGSMVSVCSTGIGGASAAIAMEELIHAGADTFIRVGTAGGMQENVCGGDLVIATGAIRSEGTSREYAPIEFPAVANPEIVEALVESAKENNYNSHIGIVHCKDSFYGQHSPETMPTARKLKDEWTAWLQCGTLASEMESAALYIVASVRGVRAGTVLLVAGNQIRREKGMEDTEIYDTENAVKTAVSALRRMIDKEVKPAFPK